MILGIALQRLLVVLVLALLLYSAVALYVYLCQEKLLYFPRTYSHTEALDRAQALGFELWPAHGPDYYGLVDSSEIGQCKGTILVFHGNAGSALDRDFYGMPLLSCGYRTILCEYPGYGARSGSVGERSFVADARRTVQAAHTQYGGPIYVLGESLGCAVAAAVCQGESPVQGCLLITPWDTLSRIAQHHYWYLPVKCFIRDSYDSIGYLQTFGGSAAIVLAEQDTLIPIEHGKRLYESISCRKRLWQLPNVGHNDWIQAVDAPWWHEVMDFVSREGK
jgi:pimeloyl-ACP methyl ester carboxylesterase